MCKIDIISKFINKIKFVKFVYGTDMSNFENNFSIFTVFEGVIVFIFSPISYHKTSSPNLLTKLMKNRES